MVPELVGLHWGSLGYEPVHSRSDRAQVSAHHWPNDRPTDKAPQSRDVDNDARPETDRQVGYVVASLFQPPGNSRSRFVHCTNFEVVAHSVDPRCEIPIVNPSASVADLVYRCFSRPLDNNVALTEGMNQLKVTGSRDDVPDFVLLRRNRSRDREVAAASLRRRLRLHRELSAGAERGCCGHQDEEIATRARVSSGTPQLLVESAPEPTCSRTWWVTACGVPLKASGSSRRAEPQKQHIATSRDGHRRLATLDREIAAQMRHNSRSVICAALPDKHEIGGSNRRCPRKPL